MASLSLGTLFPSSYCLGFQDAASPGAEALIFFHDMLMSLLLPILIGVLSWGSLFLVRSSSHRYLTDHTALEFF